MADLYVEHGPISLYRDQRYEGGDDQLQTELERSTTLYVGNLSFYTTEEQIYELFSKAGEIRRIIMGLDRKKKTPCGFCFVEYYTREDAEDCVRYINGSRLDDRVVRTDWDAGFKEGRQYGRGKSGGQVRDEYRVDYDPGRGGYGKQRELEFVRGDSGGGGGYGGTPYRKRGRDDSNTPSSKRSRPDDDEDKPDNPRFRERDSDED